MLTKLRGFGRISRVKVKVCAISHLFESKMIFTCSADTQSSLKSHRPAWINYWWAAKKKEGNKLLEDMLMRQSCHFMISRVHWPSFRWLWANTVMHIKLRVNQPSRSSTIDATALFFYMDCISLRQGHLLLWGARACLLSGYINHTIMLFSTSRSFFWF